MVETHEHFDSRLRKLGKKHAQMTDGYTAHVDRNGLITVTPKKQRTARNTNAFTILGCVLIGFFLFKAFMVSALGPVTYNDRLGKLEVGTLVERMGAKALSIDPLTRSVSEAIGPILR